MAGRPGCGRRRIAVTAAPLTARGVDSRLDVLRAAQAVLRLHIADECGLLCVGCLDRARLAPVPCPVARRAVSVVATHGVIVRRRRASVARWGLARVRGDL